MFSVKTFFKSCSVTLS
uniref:Uncharacterized protein n=1 Tax=Anguilla anguilla TaxID=7936 RepID=A0A0E9UI89_ANGAN